MDGPGDSFETPPPLAIIRIELEWWVEGGCRILEKRGFNGGNWKTEFLMVGIGRPSSRVGIGKPKFESGNWKTEFRDVN